MVSRNSRSRLVLPALFFLLGISLSSPAQAKIVDVAVGSNIQTVIDNSTTISGDTIRLASGTHSTTGDLHFGGKALTLTSATGNPADCVIVGTNADHSTFWIQPADAVGSKIMGVTIIGNRGECTETWSNCAYSGGAIAIATSIVIENCIIRDSSAELGGGVHVANNAKPKFINCVFRSNTGTKGGAVYAVDSGTTPTFQNCLFTGNAASIYDSELQYSRQGDAIHLESCGANIVNCTFVGNASNRDVISQSASNLPLMVLNSIIVASNADHYAVDGEDSGLGTTPKPNIANSYIVGRYEFLADGIAMIFEPGRVQISDGVYESYPNAQVATSSFNLGFQETTDYHLGMTSSAIGLGANGTGTDYEGEPRPYYLGSRPDIGADQFNFCFLVDNNLETNNHWRDVALAVGVQQISDNLATGLKFHSGRVRFYRIIPAVSGVMRLWTQDSTVDLRAYLTADCVGEDLLADDDGGGLDVHLDYIYARAGVPYYLGVINKSATAGQFDLYGEMVTDPVANSCTVADTVDPSDIITFGNTFFDAGYTDREVLSDIDFIDDEDCFRLDFTVPGTLVLTSKFDAGGDVFAHSAPRFVDAAIKDAECEIIAENTGSESFLIIHPNPGAGTCYLHIDRSRLETTGAVLNYGFDIRYYPLDETDPRELVLTGGEGQQSGHITVPGDRDRFYVDFTEAGVITAWTTGCAVGENARIDIYNPLNEKIADNGASLAPVSGNFSIDAAMVGVDEEAPFFVTPGRYYLRVSALNSHLTPFEYTLHLQFAASSDDHSEYRPLSTYLDPWASVSATPPRLFFYPKDGVIFGDTDVDLFRIDVPYRATVDVMSDHAASSGPVGARLLDSHGNPLTTASDIRIANPDYQGICPDWSNAVTYPVNTMVQSAGSYYRCVQEAAGDSQSPANVSYWQPVADTPLPWSGRLTRTLDEGIYYIEISGASGLDYRLSVDLDDFGDNWADPEPTRLTSAFNSIIGRLETAVNPALPWSADADAFELEVAVGNTFRIFTTGTADTYGVIKQNGTEVPGWAAHADQNYDAAGNFIIDGIYLAAGIYTVELALTRVDVDSPHTGTYAVHFDQDDDYCDSTVCPGDIPPVGVLGAVSGTQSGVIENPGDIDYFTLTPTSSGRLTSTVAPGAFNLIQNLMDAGNSRLTYSSSGTLSFDVTAGATYYLNVKPEFVLNTGSYTFTYAVEDYADADDDGDGGSTGNDFTEARPLALGATAPSSVSYTQGGINLAGDDDFFTFTLTGPGILTVYTTGSTDTYGYLFRDVGGLFQLVMSNDDSAYDRSDGYNFGMVYYVPDAGTQTFYVKVRGYSPREIGAYELHIAYASGSDDHGDECGDATLANRNTALWDGGSIIFEESSIGFVQSNIGITGDSDYFKFVAGPAATDPGSLTVFTTDGDNPLDTFGYLKNDMCGTIAMNDNGSDPSDGQNFRIAFTPTDCVIGAAVDCTPGVDCECIPRTYHVAVRSYDGVDTGTYDLHIESNGAFVEPISTTTMAIAPGQVRYFGFDTPAHQTYLTADVTGTFDDSVLSGTVITGTGQVVAQDLVFPLSVDGLSRGLHYLKVTHAGASGSGDFDLDLSCSSMGSVAYGNGAGSFVEGDGVVTVIASGSDYWNTADQGYFVYQTLDAGFEMIARVQFTGGYQEQYSKAGLMIREDVRNPAAKNVYSLIMRNADTTYSARAQSRIDSAGTTGNTADTNVGTLPSGCYIRLHYDSDSNQVVTGYSSDGAAWTETTVPITLIPPLSVGFAVSSHTGAQASEVTFSDITYYDIAASGE
ncbi:hypothetical protein JCM14469_29460 [Desulfatiferula olefinivorans]